MKRAVVVVIVLVALTSCSQYSCPTYGEAPSRSYSSSARKSKQVKGREPYYKVMKRAEQ